jgi:phosphoribosylglycinamide formyltransferase-1
MNIFTFAFVKRIAIFASGSGSNAGILIHFFESHPKAQVTLVVCNNPNAGVIDIASQQGVEILIPDHDQFYASDSIVKDLKIRRIDLIVLAGFLWLIPKIVVADFKNRIINIHPSLLPKFGGKGMYGKHVHEAVLASGEKETGITIHFINENFDEGEIIAQFSCPVLADDTPESLAKRVQELEHLHFSSTISKVVNSI